MTDIHEGFPPLLHTNPLFKGFVFDALLLFLGEVHLQSAALACACDQRVGAHLLVRAFTDTLWVFSHYQATGSFVCVC